MLKPMDLTTFSGHLDRLGADLKLWPDAAQQAARTLLGVSSESSELGKQQQEEAARLLDRARQLAQLFDNLPLEPAAAGLRGRILAELPVDSWRALSEWFHAALWRPLAAAAMPLILGFAIGVFQQPPSGEVYAQNLADELSLLPFTDSFEGMPDED